jgi:hypothetical protein
MEPMLYRGRNFLTTSPLRGKRRPEPTKQRFFGVRRKTGLFQERGLHFD